MILINKTYLCVIAIIGTFVLSIYSNKITVDTVSIYREYEKYKAYSVLPRFKTNEEKYKLNIEELNRGILDFYMIESYDQNSIEEFGWEEGHFNYQIIDNYIYLEIYAWLMHFSPVAYSDKFIYNVETGDYVKGAINIPITNFINKDSLNSIISKYWVSQCEKTLEEIMDCIYSFSCSCKEPDTKLTDSGMVLFLPWGLESSPEGGFISCYSENASRGCDLIGDINVSYDTLKGSLTEIGKALLLDPQYFKLTPLERYFMYHDVVDEKDEILFSFRTNKDKVVQLIHNKFSNVFKYRFISNNEIQLEVTDNLNDKEEIFAINGYHRGSGFQNASMSYFCLKFSNEKYNYEVYYNWAAIEEGEALPSYGVRVYKDQKVIADIVGVELLIGWTNGTLFKEILPYSK